MEKLLELDDIGLIPAQLNLGRVEGKFDFSTKDLTDRSVSLPIFTSPMESVVSERNWKVWQDNGIRPILPRTTDIKIRLEGCEYIFAAFGLKEVQEHFLAFKRNSQRQFRVCIDSGNGHDIEILNTAANLKRIYGNQVIIMAGNIANPKVYVDYCSKGIDFVRVGMNTGSLVDKEKYGFYSPLASLLLDIKGLKNTSCVGIKHAKIIADGGIRDYSDIIKALALGADYVMLGDQLVRLAEAAGPVYEKVRDGEHSEHTEQISPGAIEKMSREEIKERRLMRLYAGNTTYDVQARRDGYEDAHDWPGKRKFCDSTTKWREISGNISSWLDGLFDVFSYGFTMAGASNWDEFRSKINIGRIQ